MTGEAEGPIMESQESSTTSALLETPTGTSRSESVQDPLMGIKESIDDIRTSMKTIVDIIRQRSEEEEDEDDDDDNDDEYADNGDKNDKDSSSPVADDEKPEGDSGVAEAKDLDDLLAQPNSTKAESNDDVSETGKTLPQMVPKVRECSFEQFKTRYTDEPLHAVDVLFSKSSLNPALGPESSDHLRDKTGKAKKQEAAASKSDKASREQLQDPERWIHRIRINSKPVMRLLGKLGRRDGLNRTFQGDGPHTFMRPFRYLIYYQEAVKERLEQIQQIGYKPIPEDENSSDKGKAVDESAEAEEENDMDTSESAREELQCYINFVEERLMPDYRRFQVPDSQDPPKVRFDDLWYVFKVSGLIYVPSSESSEANVARKNSTFQSLRRIYRVEHPWYTPASITEDLCDCKICKQERDEFSVYCYYLDFDGESFGAVTERREIKPYNGERDVTQLEFYPIEYLKGHQELLQKAQNDGQMVVDAIQKRCGFYCGWTLLSGPSGTGLKDTDGKDIVNSSHIESDVLVDYREAFSTYPLWKPELQQRSKENKSISTITTATPLKNTGGKDLAPTLVDRMVSYDGIEHIEFNRNLESNRFLQVVKVDKGRSPAGESELTNAPTGHDLALVPRRFFAYVVWERRFVHLDIRYLQMRDKEGNDEAFNRLEIDPTHKKLIKSVVQSHFQKKGVEQTEDIDIETQDLIRGKGKGIIILLHGVPGVGKTATAEAVAQKWNKPLFPITCGDLGFTAESVEKSMNGIFRLAHLWDCVLLLDEADVFITQRQRTDLQRNALVSVFLRMLEYYNGILFLTTNRAGVLDEAVKSRVHLSLGYDHLNLDQTIKVFELNVNRLKEIEKKRSKDPNHKQLKIHKAEVIQFAKEHFNRNERGKGRWNGRQIRNAFLIAASLAHYGDDTEDEYQDPEEEPLQRQLRKSHFEEVEKTTLQYDEFRLSVFKKTDDELAYENQERDESLIPRSP